VKNPALLPIVVCLAAVTAWFAGAPVAAEKDAAPTPTKVAERREPPGSGAEPTDLRRAANPMPARNAHRSPVDLALGPNGTWLVTANQTADSVSLIDVKSGQVRHEFPVGRRPTFITTTDDGRILVTCSYGGGLWILRVKDGRLEREARVHLGFEPIGIAVDERRNLAYVGQSVGARIAVVDLKTHRVARSFAVGRWPRYVALTSDGSRLAVGESGEGGVAVLDTDSGKVLYRVDFDGLNLGLMQVDGGDDYVYLTWLHYGENVPSPGNIRRGWVLGNRVARVRLDQKALREAFSLDKQGDATGDAHGLALSEDGRRLVVTAGGTHEMLVFRTKGLRYAKIGGTEHIDDELLKDAQRFYRLELGGRPMGVRLSADSSTAFVANYLLDAVQVVDLNKREIVRTIHLGGPTEPALARRGEAIFYDADRSFDRWYSCHSCHYEGGSNAEIMDTLNDGSVYSFKTVLPLFRLSKTSPWTWHGWQKSLPDAMHKSITKTMVGKPPSEADVEALLAYFDALESPPNPYRLENGGFSEAAARGRKVFEGDKAGCVQCHSGPLLTDNKVHDVGTGDSGDRYRGYNTPSLRGVHRKVRLLHDGRSRSLRELLTGPHAPEKVAGEGGLTPAELDDLIAYLKSL